MCDLLSEGTLTNRAVVGVRELKSDASRILKRVSFGMEYVVTVNGKPTAVVRPWSDDDGALVTDLEIDELEKGARRDRR